MNTNLRNGGSLPALTGSGAGLPAKGFGSNPPVPADLFRSDIRNDLQSDLRSDALSDVRTDLRGDALSDGQSTSGLEPHTQKTVIVCDTQPVTAEGIRTLLTGNPDLRFVQIAETLAAALAVVRQRGPDVIVPDVIMVDKAFGIQAVLEWLNEVRLASPNISVVIWGVSVTEAEALRFLQSGARGILRKTAGINSVLACLRTVAERRSWMEDSVFRDSGRSDRYPRSELTAREQQVLELVEQGFKNKEIAQDLGIRPGTVKIHLKHIFEKTGVRGRYGLALSGLKDRDGAGAGAGSKLDRA